jgi:hypothetical protein
VTEDTDTRATATTAWPLTPSLVARIFALPPATAVTTPDAFTVATAVLVELQVMARPVRTLFAASRVTAVALVV